MIIAQNAFLYFIRRAGPFDKLFTYTRMVTKRENVIHLSNIHYVPIWDNPTVYINNNSNKLIHNVTKWLLILQKMYQGTPLFGLIDTVKEAS